MARDLGIGIGLRSAHYDEILGAARAPVEWFEAISENYMGLRGFASGGKPRRTLERVRERHPVVLHGVSLSIGSVDPLREDYLQRLRRLADEIQAEWVSDHLCWTGVHGQNLHDLMPLPYTEETLRHLVARVHRVQDALGRRLTLENVSSYVTFAHSEMTEWDFIAELARRSGCGLLVDLNNIFVSGRNHGFDPAQFLRAMPVDSVTQFHLAGHSDCGTHLVDTHDEPVREEVWALYSEAVRRFGAVPTLIEWDDKIPPLAELVAHAEKARNLRDAALAERRPVAELGA